MGHYQRSHHKVEETGPAVYSYYNKPKRRLNLFYLLLPSILLSVLLLLLGFSRYSVSSSAQEPVLWGHGQILDDICPGDDRGVITCDRANRRFDVCYMRGDVRTKARSSSLILYTCLNDTSSAGRSGGALQTTTIKPYTRKWEKETMATVGELSLVLKLKKASMKHACDVSYNVPAVFFSTSGYTGNLYHEFNDGILPLYITAQRFNKRVVFVVQEYHKWWVTKYSDILSQLTEFPPVDFTGDKRTHCFPEAIVGLKLHDELTIDPSLMDGNKTIRDFRDLLERGFAPRVDMLKDLRTRKRKTPKMVIVSRKGSRAILNERLMVKLAKKVGFTAQVMRPSRGTELWRMYRSLNSSDVMVGVHGAAMTHFLFLRRGAVFIQIIPLGTEWAAEAYYGSPARKFGLRYVGYKIQPEESSLFHEYGRDDPVIANPNAITRRGWNFTKSIYLKSQNVSLNLVRFRRVLINAYSLVVNKKEP